MIREITYKKLVTTYCLFIIFSVFVTNARDIQQDFIKPFRVLVVIGDQWNDPGGYMVEMPGRSGELSGFDAQGEGTGASDFHHLCILLKSWGIPFDIVWLDQQFLDRYMFPDMYDKPKYGTIIWSVNRTDKLLNQDYSIVTEEVKDHGTGLIALSDRISQPEIQSLNIQQPQVLLTEGTVTILEQGSWPQSTARQFYSGGNTVWIGLDTDNLVYYQQMRTLLRRAITWTLGYNLYKAWENYIIMIMDDPGMSVNAYLKRSEFEIRLTGYKIVNT